MISKKLYTSIYRYILFPVSEEKNIPVYTGIYLYIFFDPFIYYCTGFQMFAKLRLHSIALLHDITAIMIAVPTANPGPPAPEACSAHVERQSPSTAPLANIRMIPCKL